MRGTPVSQSMRGVALLTSPGKSGSPEIVRAARFGDYIRPWDLGMPNTPPVAKRPYLAAFKGDPGRFQGRLDVLGSRFAEMRCSASNCLARQIPRAGPPRQQHSKPLARAPLLRRNKTLELHRVDSGSPEIVRAARYRGYSKLRTHTARGPYDRSIPRSIGPF